MGLFSGKNYYYAYAGSQSVIEKLRSTIQGEIVTASLAGSWDYGVVDGIKVGAGIDFYSRAKAMLKYAGKEDGYIRGFPESNVTVIRIDPQHIEAALTRAVGSFDSINYVLKGRYNERFFIAKKIQEVYLDPNYFNWPNGNPSISHWDDEMESVEIPVVNPDTGTYFTSNNDFDYARYVPELYLSEQDLIDMIGSDRYVRIGEESITSEYTISFPYGTDSTYPLGSRIDIGDDTHNHQWVMVGYEVGGQNFYWAYQIGSNADPEFEGQILLEDRYGQYLPVAVLMQDKRWFDEDPDSELAKTTNKLLKKLATTGTEIREEFQEQEEEDKKANKQAEKWDFFIHFAVPIRTQVRGAKNYLYHYFRQLEEWSQTTYKDYYDYLSSQSGDKYLKAQPVSEITIKEAGINGYNVSYRWSFIKTEEHVGIYTVKERQYVQGDYDPELGNFGFGGFYQTTERPLEPRETHIEIYQRSDKAGEQEPEYQQTIDEFFGPGTPIGLDGKDPDKTGYHDIIVITDRESNEETYTRTLIMGLSMRYTINTSEDAYNYRFRYSVPELFGLEEEVKEFRIPILASSLLEVSRMRREECVQAGLTATVFLVQKVHLSWYQTGFFKWLIIIIAIIIIILSIVYAGGAGSDQAGGLIAAMVSATGASGIAAYALYVVFSFAIGWILVTAASNIGGTAGKIFLIVAMAVMLYSASAGGGSPADAWTNFASNPGWATAAKFLASIRPYLELGMNTYSTYRQTILENKYENFMEDHRDRMEKLEAAYNTLGPPPEGVDPYDIQQALSFTFAWETADEYVSRTLNTNPGQDAIEYVLNFTEAALLPPKYAGQTSIIDGMLVDFAEQRGAA
jgi:hypothetical protein